MQHQAYPYHRAENGKFLCPFRETSECTTGSFHTQRSVMTHIRKKHKNLRIPSPFESEGCLSTFAFVHRCQYHIVAYHRKEQHPCPQANTRGCKRMFVTVATTEEHARTIYGGFRYPRPYAERDACTESFTTLKDAHLHGISQHTGTRYPCPNATTHGCNEVFMRKADAKHHARSFHLNFTFPCPLAEEYDCKAGFKAKKLAKRHSQSHRNPLLCPRQRCFQRFATIKEAYAHELRRHHLSRIGQCLLLSLSLI